MESTAAVIFIALLGISIVQAALTGSFSNTVWQIPTMKADQYYIGSGTLFADSSGIYTGGMTLQSYIASQIPVGSGGGISEQYLPYDYVVYWNGTTIQARSNDPDYADQSGTDFVTVIEACFTARTSVGCNIKFIGDYSIHSTLDFPTTDNLAFSLTGNGMHNCMLTAHSDLGANVMLLCDKASWGSPQKRTTVGLYDLGLDANGVADSCLEVNYALIDINNVYVDFDMTGSNKVAIGRCGGSGGPSFPAHIGTLMFNYISGAENQKLLDLWYDTCSIEHVTMAVNMNSATQDLINLNGEFYHFGLVTLYLSSGATIDSILTTSSVYVTIDQLDTVTTSSSTINGILDIDSSSQCVVQLLRQGYSGHTIFKDADSQAATHIFNAGFNERGTATILSGATHVHVTHGLLYTPLISDIMVMAAENPTNDVGAIYVDGISSTEFIINCENDPGASNLDVVWKVQR